MFFFMIKTSLASIFLVEIFLKASEYHKMIFKVREYYLWLKLVIECGLIQNYSILMAKIKISIEEMVNIIIKTLIIFFLYYSLINVAVLTCYYY